MSPLTSRSGFAVPMGCVWGTTLSTATHRNAYPLILVSHCLLMTYAVAASLLFVIALPQQRRPKRHDAHSISHQSEPNPKEFGSHVAHLDPQHRMDNTTLNVSGRAFRAAVRWLLGCPLISFAFFAPFAVNQWLN